MVLDAEFEYLGVPHAEHIVFARDGWGYLNLAGETVIEPIFTRASDFSEGLAAVRDGDRWGYIDHAGRMVVEPTYAECLSYSGGLALVRTEEACGYINRAGEVAIALDFDDAYSFAEERAVVFGDETHVIDARGRTVFSLGSAHATAFSEGRLKVSRANDKLASCTFVDHYGRATSSRHYKEARGFAEGLAAAATAEGWGFIDLSGNFKISPRYSDVGSGFSEGLAAVQEQGLWGFIDVEGRLRISHLFSHVDAFCDGVAAVAIDGRWGLIEPSGELRVQPTFERIHGCRRHMFEGFEYL